MAVVLRSGRGLVMIILVRFPVAALARRQQRDARGAVELDDVGVAGERGEWLGEEAFEDGADPEHEIRRLDLARIRRSQRIDVRRAPAGDDEPWLADARHHAGNERMDRLDADDDFRRCRNGKRRQRRRSQQGHGKRHHHALSHHRYPPIERACPQHRML